jgi:hypothetical protein
MRIVAQSPSGQTLLVDLEDGAGRVLDLDQRKMFPPMPLDSILARGYWRDYLGPQNVADRIKDVDVLDPEPEVP